ncbi:MAG TPA: hypothetical protein VEJ37_03750 [Xanthobacteraceae bacterium]|nr:hypothetical protein [Xanthobacteraceae bacterium]
MVAELVEMPSTNDHFDVGRDLLVGIALFGSVALLPEMQIMPQLG